MNELKLNQVYEVEGYPKPFQDKFVGKYIGNKDNINYFVRVSEDERVYVSTPAHFTEVNDSKVSITPISSFGTCRFTLDQIKETDRSGLINILKELGEEL
jgi:hypothetical protein